MAVTGLIHGLHLEMGTLKPACVLIGDSYAAGPSATCGEDARNTSA
jgi:hypothetical protein